MSEEPPPPATPRTDRLLTIPNLLSVVRLACVPLFLWLLLGRHNRVGAAVLLGGLGATDWVDGYVARHLGQVSDVGKVLDPVADRILLVAAMVGIFVDGSAPRWLLAVTLAREVLVSVGVLLLAAMRAPRIDVQWIGKAGTFALMFAFPFFLLGHARQLGWHQAAETFAWVCAACGLVGSWYAVGTYLGLARRAIRQKRLGGGPEGDDREALGSAR